MTSRQFYIVFWLIVVSLKVQKMPGMMYEFMRKDFYLMLVPYIIINVIGIFMAFFIIKRTQKQTLSRKTESRFGNVLKRVLVFFIAIYFLAQALLLYETTRNLFEHILFDNLSWVVFSLLLLAVVFFLAHTGIGNIALNAELYFYVILLGYLMIAVFGASKADFSFIFPLETISIKPLLENFVRFNIWFGDFFLVLFLGKHANGIKIKWTILTYALAMGLVALLFLEFGGLYGDYVVMKPSLLSTITEQSLLDLNIGRVDWFLILFAEIGSVLSCGVCVYFSKKCMEFAFPKAKKMLLLSLICGALYLINVFYLVDTHTRILLFMKYITHVAAITKWIPFIIMFVICLFIKNNAKPTGESPPEKQLKNSQKTAKESTRKVVNNYGE